MENRILNIRKLKTDHTKDREQILRTAATVRLRHTKSSVLLKRLNYYAWQNLLYQSCRDLGRFFGTKFLLDLLFR
ncbi:Tn3 family transposase [Chryseobacterium limigenitum]|uniref:Tn3 family transposase n=1 Tax=Chryseobacterium limigenitum TaxID=1612149 RepID=UPI000931DB7F